MRTGYAAGMLGMALAVVLVEGLPLAAAGHRADAKAHRTVSCATKERALQISAFATNPQIGSANVTVSTGNPNLITTLLGVGSTQTHYGLGSLCHSVTKRIVLSRRGLTSAGAVHAGDYRSPTVYCAATKRVLMRIVISYNSSQKPVSATIEVLTQPKPHSGKKPKRIGFVQWSPQRSVSYYSAACTSQT